MHTHLLQSKSDNPLTKSLGEHRLKLCLLILRELEHNYPAATALRTLFLRASAVKNVTRQEEASINKRALQEAYIPQAALDETSSVHSTTSTELDNYLDAMFSEYSIHYPPMHDSCLTP